MERTRHQIHQLASCLYRYDVTDPPKDYYFQCSVCGWGQGNAVPYGILPVYKYTNPTASTTVNWVKSAWDHPAELDEKEWKQHVVWAQLRGLL